MKKSILILNTIVLFFINNMSAQTVTGVVTFDDWETFPGVSIWEKGTPNGTITDQNGAYSITLSDPSATLLYSFMGMETREVEVGGRTVINVQLETEDSRFYDVVTENGSESYYNPKLKSDFKGDPNFIDACNKFAFKIFNATKPGVTNHFISPLSINYALAILNEGAGTTTQKEIEQLLCIPKIKDKTLQYKLLIESLNGFTTQNKKEIVSNAIWLNDNYKLREGFKDRIVENYHSELNTFNQNNIDETNKLINIWIRRKTNNKIKDAPEVSSSTSLNVYNTTYFFNEWAFPFDSEETKDKLFYTKPGDKSKVDMMNKTYQFSYYENKKLQALKMLYKSSEFSMLIVLPKDRNRAYKNKITHDAFVDILSSMKLETVKVSLPKFKIKEDVNLKASLIENECGKIFTNPDFSNMLLESDLVVGDIIHKTFIEVSEKSTEATAMTAITVIATGVNRRKYKPKIRIFNANHPFQFYIIDNSTKAIVFMGQFTNK